MSLATETIYKMLEEANGDSQAVAAAISDELNKAIKAYESKSKEKQKLKDAEALANHMNTFAEIYYPEYIIEKNTGESIIKAYDLVEKFVTLEKMIPKEKEKKTLEDMIAEMGW